MDGNKIDLITLISVIVFVVALFKLRSVLGRRTGDDETRMERARAEQRAEAKARERTGSAGGDNENVINMPRRDRETAAGAPAATVPVAEAEERIRTFANADPAAVPGLLEILGFDDAFAPDGFLKGAKQAYEMIVTAFAEGNRKTLKDLLSREVFEGFSAAIADRESRGEIMDEHQHLFSTLLDERGIALRREPEQLTVDDLLEAASYRVEVATNPPPFRLRA